MNPFRGVEQIVESDAGRTLSVDGRNWELQMLARRPAGWGSLNREGTLGYARYAVWSASEGLALFPYFPATEFATAAAAEILLAEISRLAAALPFVLADNYECWRCADAKPVALLATSTAPPERWSVPHWRALPEYPQAALLETRVHRAGNCNRWFRRSTDGSGECLDNGAGGNPDAQVLPASAFPECLLAVDAFTLAEDRTLIVEFLARQAARLLMLPLSTATRATLEKSAIADAEGVAHYSRLYPAQADPALLTRLQVEARLRAST